MAVFAGVEKESIFIKEYSMHPGSMHKLLVSASTPGSPVTKMEESFLTNILPSGGLCQVVPNKGNSLPVWKQTFEHQKAFL